MFETKWPWVKKKSSTNSRSCLFFPFTTRFFLGYPGFSPTAKLVATECGELQVKSIYDSHLDGVTEAGPPTSKR